MSIFYLQPVSSVLARCFFDFWVAISDLDRQSGAVSIKICRMSLKNAVQPRINTDEPSAAQPQPLPLLHLMEERAGERRSVLGTDRFLSDAPLPVPLPARSSRGEGENHVAKSLSKVRDFSSLYYGWQAVAENQRFTRRVNELRLPKSVSIRVYPWLMTASPGGVITSNPNAPSDNSTPPGSPRGVGICVWLESAGMVTPRGEPDSNRRI